MFMSGAGVPETSEVLETVKSCPGMRLRIKETESGCLCSISIFIS